MTRSRAWNALALVVLSKFGIQSSAMKIEVAKQISMRALTRVEVLVVIAVVVILAGLNLPPLLSRPRPATRINCVSNLKQVGLAFRLWAGDNNDKFPMQVPITNGGTLELVSSGNVLPHFQVMSNELNTPKVIVCPADKSRARELEKLMTSSADSRHWSLFSSNCPVSYFVGLEADETQPNMLLSGDSNLEVDGKSVGPGILNLWSNATVGWTVARHERAGNVAFAEGSVSQFSNQWLRKASKESGVATNRLAIP